MITISEEVRNGRMLVSDGAWGTFLYSKGLKSGECPELWNIERFDDVVDIARSYIDAGADMIETNSFGGSGIKLAMFGLGERAFEINEAAARASRKAAGSGRRVIASVGPTGRMLIMGDVTERQMYDSFSEQCRALYSGGADAVCIETMMDMHEASVAVKAARENTPCEVICTFTFTKNARGEYRTMMGSAPAQAALAAIDAGAHIIGANCGNGIEDMIGIVRELRAAFKEIPIIVQANAGLPCNIGGRDVYNETAETMVSFVDALIDEGANIIGGCCGTTPEHIRAIKARVIKRSRI